MYTDVINVVTFRPGILFGLLSGTPTRFTRRILINFRSRTTNITLVMQWWLNQISSPSPKRIIIKKIFFGHKGTVYTHIVLTLPYFSLIFTRKIIKFLIFRVLIILEFVVRILGDNVEFIHTINLRHLVHQWERLVMKRDCASGLDVVSACCENFYNV